MNASGVIVRFLSLLDVALILLGVLMLALMQTTVSPNVDENAPGEQESSALDQVNFVYLYAGWKDEQSGHCYLLDASMKIDREVSTSSRQDLDTILSAHPNKTETANVVMLLFEEEGWFSVWPDSRVDTLEETWGVKVVRIYNVKIAK